MNLKSKGYFSGIMKIISENKITIHTMEGILTMNCDNFLIKDEFLNKDVLVYAEYEYNEITLKNISCSYVVFSIDYNVSKITKSDVATFINETTEFLKIPENRKMWDNYHEEHL